MHDATTHDATTRPSRWRISIRGLAVLAAVPLLAAACARAQPRPAVARGGGPPAAEPELSGDAPPAPQMQADVDLGRVVAQAILDEPAAAAAEVTLSVYDGVVRLEGVAPDLATHAAVLSAVWSVEGVRGVINRLTTSSVAPPSSLGIAVEVRDAFAVDPLLRDLSLEVAVEGSVVRLSGVVPDVVLRGRAEALARDVRGVRDVVNDVRVVPRR